MRQERAEERGEQMEEETGKVQVVVQEKRDRGKETKTDRQRDRQIDRIRTDHPTGFNISLYFPPLLHLNVSLCLIVTLPLSLSLTFSLSLPLCHSHCFLPLYLSLLYCLPQFLTIIQTEQYIIPYTVTIYYTVHRNNKSHGIDYITPHIFPVSYRTYVSTVTGMRTYVRALEVISRQCKG